MFGRSDRLKRASDANPAHVDDGDGGGDDDGGQGLLRDLGQPRAQQEQRSGEERPGDQADQLV